MPAHSFVNKTTDKPDYKPMEIVIIDKISERDNTLLYVGNVLEGPQKGTNVVVKVQPRIPEGVSLPISIQVTTELHIFLRGTPGEREIVISTNFDEPDET